MHLGRTIYEMALATIEGDLVDLAFRRAARLAQQLLVGDSYTEEGATAYDLADGDLTASITVDVSQSFPLHKAYRNKDRARRCLRLPVGCVLSSLR